MGTGSSVVRPAREQVQQSKKIEADIRKQLALSEKSIKLLLLGPGDSGKSTVLKQMRILHSNGFSPTEIETQSRVVRENLIMSMIAIVQAMSWLEIPLENTDLQKDVKVIEAASVDKRTFITLESSKLSGAIKRLWQDDGVQQCYRRQNEYQLMDSAKYFLDDIDRIASADYTATIDDILRCRKKTIGITEIQFELKSLLFRVMDVGGQRSQRRKWIKCFDGLDSILFVSSISEYNQRLEEESDVNRLVESLNLFDWVSNNNIFSETSIILFLNKIDLFDEKINQFPLKLAFPGYEGPNKADVCKEKIKTEFLKRNKTPKRDIYTHFTCATDTKQIKFILDSTMNSLVQARLKDTGLN